MKTSVVTILVAIFLIGCKGGNKSSDSEKTTSTQTEQTNAVVNSNSENTNSNSNSNDKSGDAVCILDKLSIRDTPGRKGKWLASMSIGEQITYTGEKVIDSISKKEYSKVKLIDGKEGWTRSDFVVVGGKVGAMLDEAVVYKRPDLLTKTSKKYSPMDIIAVVTTQGEWIKIKGKRRNGKYVEEAWIKSSNISETPVDIATAKYATMALLKGNNADKIKELREITNNSDLSSSKFIPVIIEKINELQQQEALEPKDATEQGVEN